eukprot:CAMPEP_0206137648 /NCGR_PEP_ID=MMETSP1473-20131121/2736_1 /ASSEMBLY_ACC=CAM_ASM_001109 /TAXON_ID=1461547 /ORGANISM="Stichococcus sp, Strain RCC1054" /LENGTH=148 /DNA_ID=CAMNT_0053530837 /DNA_START=4721 /DNA_END=5167 /DNA_ORIENTATION=+
MHCQLTVVNIATETTSRDVRIARVLRESGQVQRAPLGPGIWFPQALKWRYRQTGQAFQRYSHISTEQASSAIYTRLCASCTASAHKREDEPNDLSVRSTKLCACDEHEHKGAEGRQQHRRPRLRAASMLNPLWVSAITSKLRDIAMFQ